MAFMQPNMTQLCSMMCEVFETAMSLLQRKGHFSLSVDNSLPTWPVIPREQRINAPESKPERQS